MPQIYNHAFDFAFSIETTDETGENITGAEFRRHIMAALARLTDDDIVSNCGMPFDTYDVDPDYEVYPK